MNESHALQFSKIVEHLTQVISVQFT